MVTPQDIVGVWSIIAAFDAAFMLSSRYEDDSKTFIKLVSDGIFEVNKIFSNLHYEHITKDEKSVGMQLFNLCGFPKMCVYAFSFSLLCIGIAIVQSGQGDVILSPEVEHTFLSLIICYVIVMSYVGLMGEAWIFRREFFKHKDLKDAVIFCTTFVEESIDGDGRIRYDRRPYEDKEIIQPAHSYLQAIIIIIIICAFCVIRYISIQSGYVTCHPVSPVVWNLSVGISVLLPLLPFVVYTCIIRHRRNVVKEFLLYQSLPNLIKNGWSIRFVNFFKAALYGAQSLAALFAVYYIMNTCFGYVTLGWKHFIIFYFVISSVHGVYFALENRSRINSKNPDRNQDIWRDLTNEGKLIWSVVRDTVTVSVLLQVFNSFDSFTMFLPIIIMYALILAVLLRCPGNALMNRVKAVPRIRSWFAKVGLLPGVAERHPQEYIYYKKKDRIVPAIWYNNQYYGEWVTTRTQRQMESAGYNLVVKNDINNNDLGE